MIDLTYMDAVNVCINTGYPEDVARRIVDRAIENGTLVVKEG